MATHRNTVSWPILEFLDQELETSESMIRRALVTEPGNTHTLTVEVPAGTSNNTIESGWIRAYGLDGAAAKVTRVQQFQTAVNVATGGSGNYVDVIGYALFKVTTIDANDVYGQAISGTYLDPNDSALAEGKKFGLVPWEEP